MADHSSPPPPPPPALPSPGSRRRRKRVILFNGWLRTVDYPYLWMRHLSHHLQQRFGEELEVIGNQLVVDSNDIRKYIAYLASLVGTPDEDTYFIGQSIGCQVILRYLAELPRGVHVGGFLATGCWLKVDYDTRTPRTPAIEAFVAKDRDKFALWEDYSGIDFQTVRRVCRGNLIALMGDNDPFRGLDDGGECNRRDWEEVVGARVMMRPGKGHYSMVQLDEEDLALVESFLDRAGPPLPPSSLPPGQDLPNSRL